MVKTSYEISLLLAKNKKPFSDEEIIKEALSIFENTQLATFWRKIGGEYPLLSEKALKILIPFSTRYRSESGFSTMVTMKTKARNRLNLEHIYETVKNNKL
ncbi:unnamed protein product [Macrosiphum euphorbiae]|uniref:HAT C-terminal dimerisation domain-containing protein n=1 Tax=Macrosiphum euphorbiae TaxID=13131 RepID=A0AAV0WJM2_9HEMI|nr:unnamed protein product [Macrosiphum euphorbiae]